MCLHDLEGFVDGTGINCNMITNTAQGFNAATWSDSQISVKRTGLQCQVINRTAV